MNGGMGGWWFPIFGPLVGVLTVGVIGYLLWSVLADSDSSGPRTEATDAMETLEDRYARGDIDEDEFERRARTLREQ